MLASPVYKKEIKKGKAFKHRLLSRAFIVHFNKENLHSLNLQTSGGK